MKVSEAHLILYQIKQKVKFPNKNQNFQTKIKIPNKPKYNCMLILQTEIGLPTFPLVYINWWAWIFCPTPHPLVPYSSTSPYAFYYMLSFCVHFFHLLFLSLRSWDYPLFNRKYMSKLQKVLPSEKLDYWWSISFVSSI